MYYRYELYVGDEYQGIGFLQGLSELWLDEDYEESLLNMFIKMKIPSFYMGNKLKTKAYFTERGKRVFQKAIQKVIDVFNENGMFEVREKIDDFKEDEILYEDEYQIIVEDKNGQD